MVARLRPDCVELFPDTSPREPAHPPIVELLQSPRHTFSAEELPWDLTSRWNLNDARESAAPGDGTAHRTIVSSHSRLHRRSRYESDCDGYSACLRHPAGGCAKDPRRLRSRVRLLPL